MTDRECGLDPMGADQPSADTPIGMRATIRYLEQAAEKPRSDARVRIDPASRSAARPPSFDETIDELRTMQLEALRERVGRSDYEVDSKAVAGAILARLLAERQSPAGRQS